MLAQTVCLAVAQQFAPPEASPILKQCMAELEKNRGFHEYRDCVYKLDKGEADQLNGRACNNKICIYRLDDDGRGQGGWEGSGFRLQFGPQDSLGMSKIILTGPDGKETILEQSCGASGCSGPDTVGGAIRGATFYGPYGEIGNDKTQYIVLQIPVTKVTNDQAKLTPIVCDNHSKIPCPLQMRTVDYRYDIYGDIAGLPDSLRTRSLVERLKFTNGADVYLFVGDGQDRLSDTGYVYLFGQEINFAVNQLRAPSYVSWNGVQFMKGSMTVHGDAVVRSMAMSAIRNGQTWIDNRQVEIRVSPDTLACSVTAASWTVGNVTAPEKYNLKQSLECKLSN
jgi:hypothetical protein